jgi:TonB family protein
MFPALQHPRRQDHSPRPAAVVSAALHAVAFFALVHAPAVTLPRPSESEYKQAIAGREEKIVWYKFHNKLPDISPRAAASKEPLRASNKAEQSIVSSARNAPARDRVVWTSAPPVREVAVPDAPNIVAVKLPPAPQPKPFVAPETNRTVAPQTIKQPAVAPELSPAAIVSARVPPAPQMPEAALAPKPFLVPPQTPRPRSARPVLASEAPQVVAPATRVASTPEVALAPKPFRAPARHLPHAPVAPAMAAEAPVLLVARPHEATQTISPVLAPKPFTAPPSARKTPPGTGAMPAPEPDAPVLQANSKDLSLAVVGLNPGNHELPPLSSSPADFSAGPQVRSTGSNSQQTSTALSVPGLFVGKARQSSRSDLLAEAFDSPTSPERLRAAIASVNPKPPSAEAQGGPVTSHSGAVRVADAPEPRFAGRDVFMMAIQMPNLTSYSGSWLMWYADRTQQQAEREPIAPPVPHHKVDPKYIASAVAERVEGKVRLACVITRNGKVGGIELLRGLDDRLNRSAQEALGKWEFYPATRRGEPVDVDAVVEIPFRLEPLAPKP